MGELPSDEPPQLLANSQPRGTLGFFVHSEIRVRWNANEPVEPEVLVREQSGNTPWNLDDVLDDPVASSGLQPATSRPDVTVSGLRPNTTYNYVVRMRDENNNTTVPPFVGIIRTQALGGSSVSVTRSPYSPTLNWRTNFPANRTVRYGEDQNNLDQVVSVPDVYENSHSVVLPRLKPGTKYYYRIDAVDADNDASIVIPALSLATPSFTTDRVTFSKPTVVTHAAGHHVSWSTNVPGTSELWFGTLRDDVATSGACVDTCQVATNSDDLRTAHAVSLDRPSTEVLYIRPVVREGAAMEARGSTLKVVTPAIKALETAFTNIVASEAILSFRADRQASVTVAIATAALPVPQDEASFTYVPVTPGPGTHFRVELEGLAPETRYHVWMRLVPVYPAALFGNEEGSPTILPAGSFLTPAAP
jgi:chitodextrinase